jgi:hypothetical protein
MNVNSVPPASWMTWRANIGRVHSKNCIVVDGDRLFIGTCGHHWNVDDDEDGVSLLDVKTGDLIWFTATGCDVNGICRAGGYLLCPTDKGSVFFLDAVHGNVSAIIDLDSAALSRPLVWHDDEGKWEAIVISAAGTVYQLGPTPSDVVKLGSVGEPVRADLVDISSQECQVVVVATESGSVIRCVLGDGHFKPRILSRVTYKSHPLPGGGEVVETPSVLHAAPAVEGNRLYFGFARDTYYPTAPLVCIDAITGDEIWRAPRLPQKHCGNCRVTPAIVGPYIATAFAYSNSLHVFNKENGAFVAAIGVGQHVYQQWSAPTRHGEHTLLLGRVDGRLSIIDLLEKKLVASISLATHEAKLGPVEDAGCEGRYALYPRRRPLGICGTPTSVGNNVFVGTTSGDLFAIDIGPF